jgi:hypothetical protein
MKLSNTLKASLDKKKITEKEDSCQFHLEFFLNSKWRKLGNKLNLENLYYCHSSLLYLQ